MLSDNQETKTWKKDILKFESYKNKKNKDRNL